MAEDAVRQQARGQDCLLDHVVDNNLAHVHDPIPGNVRPESPVQTLTQPLCPRHPGVGTSGAGHIGIVDKLELYLGVDVALEADVTGLMSHLSLIVLFTFTDLKILYIYAYFCRLCTTSLFSLLRKLHDI